MIKNIQWFPLLFLTTASLIFSAGCAGNSSRPFSGQAAYEDAKTFLEFGPRVSGTEANRKAGDWILDRSRQAGWETFTDEGQYQGVLVRNLAAKKGQGPVVLLGAHYDSRKRADQDQTHPELPVLGADDGASGVVVILELARSLDLDWSKQQVWLAFFDAEDNGGLDGWDWIVGSRQFARFVEGERQKGTAFQGMVLLDMVADGDQQFYWEGNSDPDLRSEIWSVAEELGFGEVFHPVIKHTMIDDHIPFRDLGIPSVDIIDFDYPYWHTAEDTFDKINPTGLERIGRTLEVWLEEKSGS